MVRVYCPFGDWTCLLPNINDATETPLWLDNGCSPMQAEIGDKNLVLMCVVLTVEILHNAASLTRQKLSVLRKYYEEKTKRKKLHLCGLNPLVPNDIYRVSRGECARLRENVPYVKVHRSNPKHLYPKFNGYRDKGETKVWPSCGSTYCTSFACCLPVHCACPSFSLTAESSTFRLHYQQMLQLQWIVIQ